MFCVDRFKIGVCGQQKLCDLQIAMRNCRVQNCLAAPGDCCLFAARQ